MKNNDTRGNLSPLSATWHFNGVISGVAVGTIYASGVANF